MVTEISDWNDLDGVRNNLTEDYVLVNDLDSNTTGYSGIGDAFAPISGTFQGMFNGNGYSIRDLVKDPNVNVGAGLFAIIGTDSVVENLFVSGTVDSSESIVGGVFSQVDGIVRNCGADIDVNASTRAGGLIGILSGTVEHSFSTGSVTGGLRVGGLVGGVSVNSATVLESYSITTVDGDQRVGGLVGENTGTVEECYAAGSVTGNTEVAALVGYNVSQDGIIDSYADQESSGQASLTTNVTSVVNSTLLTTSQMKGQSAEVEMAQFDFTNTWDTQPNI